MAIKPRRQGRSYGCQQCEGGRWSSASPRPIPISTRSVILLLESFLDSSSPHSSSNTSGPSTLESNREPHNEVSARLSRYRGKVRAGVAAGSPSSQRSLEVLHESSRPL